jgi:hypothetical protein
MKTVGYGYVNGPYTNRGEGAWYYRVNGYEKVMDVGLMLWPYLSPIKRAQFKKVIKAYEDVH